MAKKKSIFRKVVKWFSISLVSLILLVITALIIIPVFYKDEIRALVKRELEKTIQADIQLGEIGLNLFKTWPNVGVEINDLALRTYDSINPDTLFYVNQVVLGANAKAYLDNKDVILNEIRIDRPQVSMVIDSSGNFNWDIFKVEPSDSMEVDTTKATPLDSLLHSLQLDEFKINNASLYLANEMNHSFVRAQDLNFEFSGDLSKRATQMKADFSVEKLKVIKNRKLYLDDAPLIVKLNANANRDSSKVQLNDTKVVLGDVSLDWSGLLQRQADSTLYVKTDFSTNELKIERLLELIPQKDKGQYKNLKSGGKTQFTTSIEGQLNVKERLFPQTTTNVKIQDGYLTSTKKPEQRIDDIDFDLLIHNQGAGERSSRIDLKQFSFKVQGQPFSLKLLLEQKRRYADVQASLRTDIDLEDLAMLTGKSDSLTGHIHADMFIHTNTKDLKEKRYEKVEAKGDLVLSEFLFKPKNREKAIRIDLLDIYVDQTEGRIDALDLSLGNSDLHISGVVDNYLEYLLYGNYLSANLEVKSDEVDFKEIASALQSFPTDTTSDDSITVVADTIPQSPFLPDSIQLSFKSEFKRLSFGDRTVENLKGDFVLKNKVFSIENVSANLFNGSFYMKGNYNTVNHNLIQADLDVGIQDIDLQKVFGLVNQMMPEYQLDSLNLNGDIGAKLRVKADMDSALVLKKESLKFHGSIFSKTINIQTRTKGITANNFRAQVDLKEGSLRIDEMNIDLLGGNFHAKGGIARGEEELLVLDFVFDMNHLDLKEAYDSLKYNLDNIPNNYDIRGDIDAHFSLNTNLSKDFKVIKPSLVAKGSITSEFVNLGESEGLSELMDSLGVERLDSVKVRDINMGFLVKDERFIITASTLTLGRFMAATKGRVLFDGQIENVVVVDVDKKNKEGNSKEKGTSLKGGLILYGSLEDLIYNIDVRLNKNSVIEELDRLEEKSFKKQEKAKAKEKKKKRKKNNKGN